MGLWTLKSKKNGIFGGVGFPYLPGIYHIEVWCFQKWFRLWKICLLDILILILQLWSNYFRFQAPLCAKIWKNRKNPDFCPYWPSIDCPGPNCVRSSIALGWLVWPVRLTLCVGHSKLYLSAPLDPTGQEIGRKIIKINVFFMGLASFAQVPTHPPRTSSPHTPHPVLAYIDFIITHKYQQQALAHLHIICISLQITEN